jgi:hypothetical protein
MRASPAYRRATRVVQRYRPRGGGALQALGGVTNAVHTTAAKLGIFPAQVAQWRALLERYAGQIPVPYLLAWILHESFGNPCSYTSLHESGIFQLMPPDNTNRGGTTESELRAACVGATQTQSRPLTTDEAARQVQSGIQYVNYLAGVAKQKLDAAGASWSAPDFWRFVKLQHAYPGPTAGWLAKATQMFGRPPRTFAEFRAANKDVRQDVLDNADWVGSFAGGGVAGLELGTWLAIGAVVTAAVIVYRKGR